jgi:branched-chain amino acid transport system substrate-binding protein
MVIGKWQALVAAALLGSTIAASAEPGVTPNGILVGQSAALSGPASDLGLEMRKGITAYFERVNKAGGVNGRALTLKSLDDGYEATRAAANTRTLIESDQVFALLGYVGTPTSEAAKPIFTAAKVPFVGPFTGAELLRTPLNRATTPRPRRSSISSRSSASSAWQCSIRTTRTARPVSRASRPR